MSSGEAAWTSVSLRMVALGLGVEGSRSLSTCGRATKAWGLSWLSSMPLSSRSMVAEGLPTILTENLK